MSSICVRTHLIEEALDDGEEGEQRGVQWEEDIVQEHWIHATRISVKVFILFWWNSVN